MIFPSQELTFHTFLAFGGPYVLSFCGSSQATGGNFKSWDNIIGQALNHLHNCPNGIAMRGDENGLASLTKGSKVEAIPGKNCENITHSFIWLVFLAVQATSFFHPQYSALQVVCSNLFVPSVVLSSNVPHFVA